MWEILSAVIKSKNEMNNIIFKSMFIILWHLNTLEHSITLHTPPLPYSPFETFIFCFLRQTDELLWNFSNILFLKLTYEKNVLMENTQNICVHSLFYLNKIHRKHHLHHHYILQQMKIYTGNTGNPIFFCFIFFNH